MVLVGLPGTGKSATAKAVAAALNVPAVDTDAVLESRLPGGVAGYLQTFGEEPFRAEEYQVLVEALASDDVVSTGGGVIESAKARAVLSGELVVWLDANDEYLLPRLVKGNRPLLGDDHAAGLATLRDRRSRWYQEVSTINIDCSRSVDEVSHAILEAIGVK